MRRVGQTLAAPIGYSGPRVHVGRAELGCGLSYDLESGLLTKVVAPAKHL
jgi:hypothetical protein